MAIRMSAPMSRLVLVITLMPAVQFKRSKAWKAWLQSWIILSPNRSEPATSNTSRKGIEPGKAKWDNARTTEKRAELATAVVTSALPQYRAKRLVYRATFLTRRFPLPNVPNG